MRRADQLPSSTALRANDTTAAKPLPWCLRGAARLPRAGVVILDGPSGSGPSCHNRLHTVVFCRAARGCGDDPPLPEASE